MATTINIREAREALERHLRGVPGIGAIGVAWTPSGDRCLRVNVESGFPIPDKIPPTFAGMPVTVQSADIGHLSSVASEPVG